MQGDASEQDCFQISRDVSVATVHQGSEGQLLCSVFPLKPPSRASTVVGVDLELLCTNGESSRGLL